MRRWVGGTLVAAVFVVVGPCVGLLSVLPLTAAIELARGTPEWSAGFGNTFTEAGLRDFVSVYPAALVFGGTPAAIVAGVAVVGLLRRGHVPLKPLLAAAIVAAPLVQVPLFLFDVSRGTVLAAEVARLLGIGIVLDLAATLVCWALVSRLRVSPRVPAAPGGTPAGT